MFWWLLFGGIALLAVLVFARLGWQLFRKGSALYSELQAAQSSLQQRLDTFPSQPGVGGRMIGRDTRESPRRGRNDAEHW